MTEIQEARLKEAVAVLQEHFDAAVVIVHVGDEHGKLNSQQCRWTCNVPMAIGLNLIAGTILHRQLNLPIS